MAVVYPTTDPNNPPAPTTTGGRIANFYEKHFALAAALTLGLALLVGFIINKIRNGSSASSSSQQPQTLYVPTQNTFENNYNGVSGGASSGLPPPAFTGPPDQKPGATAVIRASGQFPTWDSAHSGVPIRSGAGGSFPIIGYAPWGSSINLTGAAITGTSNQSGDPSEPGSTSWLPILTNGQTGYVSQADTSSINLGTGSGGDPFLDGHLPAMHTIFSMNHGVDQHLNNVLGA